MSENVRFFFFSNVQSIWNPHAPFTQSVNWAAAYTTRLWMCAIAIRYLLFLICNEAKYIILLFKSNSGAGPCDQWLDEWCADEQRLICLRLSSVRAEWHCFGQWRWCMNNFSFLLSISMLLRCCFSQFQFNLCASSVIRDLFYFFFSFFFFVRSKFFEWLKICKHTRKSRSFRVIGVLFHASFSLAFRCSKTIHIHNYCVCFGMWGSASFGFGLLSVARKMCHNDISSILSSRVDSIEILWDNSIGRGTERNSVLFSVSAIEFARRAAACHMINTITGFNWLGHLN